MDGLLSTGLAGELNVVVVVSLSCQWTPQLRELTLGVHAQRGLR